ncbi:MAG: HAMP domain-containing histidine kinase [Clostridia bacterium]|nr:HAMP domain-containing histidine kinase [Clostridia bacterium]
MRQRLFSKYFLATTVIVLISLTVMLTILTFVYNKNLSDTKYDTLSNVCESVLDFTNKKNDGSIGESELYYLVSNLASTSDTDVYITDTDGVITACSCKDFTENGNCDHSGSKIESEFIGSISKDKVNKLSDIGIYKNLHQVTASAIKSQNGETEGYVIATATLTSVKTLMRKMTRLYVISAIIPIVLMFFALYFMTYRMTRPLKLMSVAAKAMAKGDFSKRIPVTSDDEIGELAVSFNQMTNSLARLEEMRKSFVANVSHELKTPMTTISGFIDGIIDGTISEDKQRYYLSIVSDEVRRLSRMVQSMLSVSKLESGEFVLKNEKFDFKELLLNIVISQEQRIEEQCIEINGLDEIESVTVSADKDLIHRAIYNLVDNAIKFNRKGGKIDFSLKIDSKRMLFYISNTGNGIPQAELPFVFERFYKVDKSRSDNKNSTGLGLYIVKTIIKTHGGTVAVSSRENELTQFEVSLPLVK